MAKSTLTKDKIARLAKSIRMGVSIPDALATSQVASSTYYRWMSIGEALCESDLEYPDIPKRPTRKASESDRKYNRRLRRHDETLERYATLYETIRDAAFLCQIDMLMVIRAAAIEKGDWRAAIWFLERRSPNDWNLKWILRNLAAEQKHQQQEHSIRDPEWRELIRAIDEHTRAITKETEDDIRAKAWNGSDSLP
jgi:hypothetical protein